MKNNLANNLKKLRKQENLSQEQLADNLGVSRQSVSKWETGDAYPEMEKIIFLCKEYNLNVNDLLNGDIYETKQKNEAFKDVYKTLDKAINFFVDSFSLFFKMTLKSKIIFVLEVFFLFLALGAAFFIAGELLGQIFGNLLYSLFPVKLFSAISNIFYFIFYFAATIFSIVIVSEIVKNRYLKYYNKDEEAVEESFEKKDNDENNLNKTSSRKIVLRDPSDSNYKVINIFYKIIIYSIKLFSLFMLIPFITVLIFLAFALVGSLLVSKTGFFFVGLVVVILGAVVFIAMSILLIANFLFNRKNNYKLFIYSSLINLIIIGLGTGLIFVGALSFDITNNYNKNLFIQNEEILEMDNDYVIAHYNIFGDIEFVEDERNDLKITYESNKLFSHHPIIVLIQSYSDEDYKVIHVKYQDENPFKTFRNVLKSINEDKKLNYSDSVHNFKVYASKENIEILKENIKIKYGS